MGAGHDPPLKGRRHQRQADDLAIMCGLGGFVRLTVTGRKAPYPTRRSGSGSRSRPRPVSFSTQVAEGRPADQVGLEIEGVVDRGVGGEELLG